MQSFRFPFLLVFLVFRMAVSGQTVLVRPVISHDPPRSVVQGRSLRVLAEIKSQRPVQDVTLFLAQSGGAEPVQLPMRSAGSGVYTVQVGSGYFTGLTSFRYYITAKDNQGAWSETNWYTVQVVGSGSQPAKQQEEWVRPVLIGAGAVAAVGVGVAVAGGGGGGGGSGDGDSDNNGGGGGDPADQVIVRSASDRVETATPTLPDVTQVDAGGELGGRTLNRVRIRLEFDAVDAGAEQVQVVYNGDTVLSRTISGQTVDQVDVVGADSSIVTIQVTASDADGGQNQYQWSATVTYFVE